MQFNDYEIITLNEDNILKEDIVCARSISFGENNKKEWMKERFKEGLIFKMLKTNGRSFGLIEYIPSEYAWRPISALGYMFINCFRISQFKEMGFGSLLIDECMKDSRKKNGVIVMVSGKTMLPKREFFISKGFEICDSAPVSVRSGRIELLVKRFKKAPLPVFKECAREGFDDNDIGFTFYYSDQCPYLYRHMDDMIEAAELYNIPVRVIRISSREEAQNSPTPYPTLSIFYRGKFLMWGIRKNEFGRFLEKISRAAYADTFT